MALSQLDQIRKFETGVEKIRQSVPMEAHDPSVGFTPAGGPASAPPRPAISAVPTVPKRTSAALNPGPAYSGGEQSPFGGFNAQPTPGAFKMPTVGGYYRDRREAAERASLPTPAGGRSAGASRRGGAAMRLDSTAAAAPAAAAAPVPRPAPAATPASPVANAVQNSGMPAGITRTLDAAGNPVYSGTGASVAAAGGPPQGSTVVGQPSTIAMPQRSLPQDVVAPSNQASQYQARGRQGGIIENPATGSVADQITRAMGSPSLKGSPLGRAAVAQAILQQAGFANDERQSALRTGDQADLQSINNNANANENFARRRFDASKFNVGMDLQAQELEARQKVPFEQQPILRGLDGGTSVLHRDGTLSALTNKDGTPFRVLDPSQRTTVSPDTEFKALTDELTSLAQTPGGDNTARTVQIQQRMAQLNGTATDAGVPDGAIAKLRQDPKLAAEFDSKYGAGASARYLNR